MKKEKSKTTAAMTFTSLSDFRTITPKNMNSLAALADGEALMFANDDLILDPGCVDAALALLSNRPGGPCGALLQSAGSLSHAGINDLRCFSYHLLDRLLPVKKMTEA